MKDCCKDETIQAKMFYLNTSCWSQEIQMKLMVYKQWIMKTKIIIITGIRLINSLNLDKQKGR